MTYEYEQREELHTVDRAMGVHRSSPTTRPVRALGGLVDHAVIGRATPRDRTGKVESNQGGKTMHIVEQEIATDEHLSLTTCESGIRPEIPLRPDSHLQVERQRSARAARCRSIFCRNVVIVALSPMP